MEAINGSHENLQNTGWNLTEHELEIARINNVIYYSIMIPLALSGNIFTLTAVIMVLKIKKNIPNLMIGVLACTDLISIVTCHLISMASMVRGAYIGSEAICHFQSMMAYTYFKMGFLTKCCISLDRFIALAYPLQYRKLVTMKRVVLLTIHNVIFSVGTSALTIIIDDKYVYQLPTWYMCVNDFQYYTTYKLIIVVGEGAIFTLGVILFFISNITVIRVVINLNKRRKIKLGRVASVEPPIYDQHNSKSEANKCTFTETLKSIFQRKPSLDENSNDMKIESLDAGDATDQVEKMSTGSQQDSIGSVDNNESKSKSANKGRQENRRQKRQQKELQLAKLVTIIVSVFVLLWLPYMTIIYWEHHNRDAAHPFVEDIVIKLVFANCCINPLLYGVFNANFRKAYVYYIRMLCFYFTCKMTKRPEDIRYNDARFEVHIKKKLSTIEHKFGRQDMMGEPTDISDFQHSDIHQQVSLDRRASVNSLNQILKEVEDDADVKNTEVDAEVEQRVLTQAIHSLYKVTGDSSEYTSSKSLTEIST